MDSIYVAIGVTASCAAARRQAADAGGENRYEGTSTTPGIARAGGFPTSSCARRVAMQGRAARMAPAVHLSGLPKAVPRPLRPPDRRRGRRRGGPGSQKENARCTTFCPRARTIGMGYWKPWRGSSTRPCSKLAFGWAHDRHGLARPTRAGWVICAVRPAPTPWTSWPRRGNSRRPR